MKIEITLTDEQAELLQSHSTIIGDNYFMPYWFKRIYGNKFELLRLGSLPPEMSAEIEEMRNQIDIPMVEIDESLFDEDSYLLASENMKCEIKNHPELLYRKTNNTVLPPKNII